MAGNRAEHTIVDCKEKSDSSCSPWHERKHRLAGSVFSICLLLAFMDQSLVL